MRYLLIAVIAVAGVAAIALIAAPLQLVSPVSYFIEDGKGIPGFDSGDPELANMALAAWARESGGKLQFVRAPRVADAQIQIHWIAPGDGLYGETQRRTINGKPGAVVNVLTAIDGVGEPLVSRAKSDRLLRDTIVYLTCVHEIGHAIGLSHTSNFEDIMYYFGYGGDFVEYFSRYRRKLNSRADIAKFSGASDGDVAALKKIVNANGGR